MVTFAKMELFTNKCYLCQHLLQSDLHTEAGLAALICSSLSPLVTTKLLCNTQEEWHLKRVNEQSHFLHLHQCVHLITLWLM